MDSPHRFSRRRRPPLVFAGAGLLFLLPTRHSCARDAGPFPGHKP